MSGIETIQLQTTRGHIVQDRCFHMRVTVITGFFPAMIIAHHQDDVGWLREANEFPIEHEGGDEEKNSDQAIHRRAHFLSNLPSGHEGLV